MIEFIVFGYRIERRLPQVTQELKQPNELNEPNKHKQPNELNRPKGP